MTLTSLRRALCAAAIVTGLASAVQAQSTTEGGIAGVVRDATGAAIPGASVTLHDEGTNADTPLRTDGNGYYKQALLLPGTYDVIVKAQGFGDYKATSVAVTVGSVSEVDATMTLGSTASVVEVSGEAPVLKFESPEISTTLTSKEILDLPLNGGRWSDLALLTPGAISDANGFGLIVFRGVSPLLNNIEIDGADDNQAFFSEERGRTREGYSTSQIAIQEFQVNTGVYSAEFGRAAGGVINSVTKSGSNTLHGQAYFYDRDNDWGAINPFTTLTSVTPNLAGGAPTIVAGVPFKPKDWRKRWGFGAGGPLVKDKLFWFYAYDQYRRNFPGVAKPSNPATFFNQYADMSLPTGTACTATATKASLSAAPSTGNTAGDTNACALAFRVYGGSYPTAAAHYNNLLFGKALSGITGLTGPGLLDDVGTTPRTGNEELNTPKLDWQINPRQHVSFLYHRLRWDSPGGVQTQTSNNYAVDTFGTDFVKLDYGLARLNTLITGNLVNELRFQYGRELNDEGEQPFSSFTSTYLNNSTASPVQLAIYGNPTGASTNYGFTAGMPYYSFRAAYPDERKTQLGDTANWQHGNHGLKFGFDILRNADVINNLYESNGVYTYTSFSDLFADILAPNGTCDSSESQTGLGTYTCYYGFTQGFGTPRFALTTMDYAGFVQDDWHVRSNLTLNVGVRYDYEHVPPPYPALVNSSVTNTAITVNGKTYPQTAITGIPGANISNQPSDTRAVGPRFGFSWDPFSKGSTVLHGGYGIYYGRNLNGVVLNAYEAAGSPYGQYTIPSVYGNKTAANGGTGPAFPQIIGAGNFPTPGVDFFAANFKNPTMQEFDLNVQQSLGSNYFLTISYLGALGRDLPNFLNLNVNPAAKINTTLTVQPNGAANCGPIVCGTTVATSYYAKYNQCVLNGVAVSGFNSATNTCPTGAQPGFLNPFYGNITEVVSNINSNYNGLVFDFQNRSNKYAQFDMNYTWSHALDFNQNQSTAPSTNNWYDPWTNARANYGNSNYNVPNRFVGWALLQYPTHFSGWMQSVAGGWHLNPILQIQNGLPYSAGVSGTISGAQGSGLNGSGSSGYLLLTGRNTFKQPNTIVGDLRVQKDLKLSERFNLELLTEIFNVPNHNNITAVSSTAYSISGANLNWNAPTGQGVNASGFGTASNSDSTFVYSQRQVQIGAKLDF